MTSYSKDPVKIRFRALRDGRRSIYLDIRVGGRRQHEALKLYLLPDDTAKARLENKEVMAMAESVRATRLIDIRNKAFRFKSEAPEVDFVQFSTSVIEGKPSTVRQNLRSALLQVIAFGGDSIPFEEITPEWVGEFFSFLKARGLRPNTQRLYSERFREMLDWGVKAEIIAKSPAAGVRSPRGEDSKREYLTEEELRRLARAECRGDVKGAFLFSCLTGLRCSDIRALRWRDVEEVGCRTRLIFRQKKTKGLQYLDLGDAATSLLGVRWDDEDAVFPLPDNTTISKALYKWCKSASVNKHITFHCARHTFATLQISAGTDIYTLSALLGHRSVKTTQIYAKVVDAERREAMDRLPKIF